MVAFGTDVLPVDPAVALRDGAIHRAPVLIGTTSDEGSSVAASIESQLATADDYRAALAADFGRHCRAVEERYPPREHPAQAYAAVVTDGTWVRTTAQARRALGAVVPTFAFEFADRSAPNFTGLPDPGFPLGAFHGADVQYLFDIVGSPVSLSPDQRGLADAMVGHWARFARTGDPGWSRFDEAAPHVQVFGDAREHHLDFWIGLDLP